ncbi:MAG TPA: hypothetical protein VMA35_08560 [Candidatus Sulfopaludibacter sp.]|nr:hypothetical protein [Candidatus Sulfopaludibacter sp.]
MKNYISKIMVLSLSAAALSLMPVLAHGQDMNTNAPSAGQTAPKPKTHGAIPFHGKIDAVDTSAMTLKVGARIFEITADTKIFNNGEPATLADAKAGEPVRGTYKKTEAGKLEAVTVHLGAKAAQTPKPDSSGKN